LADRPIEIRYNGRRVRNLDFIKQAIDELPRRLRGGALEAGAKYYMKQFKLYPRYKEVRRARAYPEVRGFFSDKQRKFVMAGIRDGRINPGSPHRNQDLKNAWHIEGKGVSLAVVNDNPAAVFAYSPLFQARQLEMVGWKNIDIMEEENRDDALLEVEIYVYNNVEQEFDNGAK